MAGGFQNLGKDSLDITELASLNDDISDELLDKLEHDISQKMGIKIEEPVAVDENDDSTLFEETQKGVEKTIDNSKSSTEKISTAAVEEQQNSESKADDKDEQTPKSDKPEKADVIQSFDDNFIKKYKAKLKNRAQGKGENTEAPSYGGVAPDEETNNTKPTYSNASDAEGDIAALSQGNISERALSKEQKDYNDSLDFLDRNIKYSKYVIYIDPQNVNFIESLTVKERKNLINGILRQQDDIAITKLRFKVIQTIIRHAIILVLTLAISIPVVYHVINASLEATINNHRSAQTNWQALYKEHGKITQN